MAYPVRDGWYCIWAAAVNRTEGSAKKAPKTLRVGAPTEREHLLVNC